MNNPKNLRRSQRIPVCPKGTVSYAGGSYKCLVQDVSGNGVLIVCTKTFNAGEILDLKCELHPGSFVECKIEVRHSSDDGTGTRIVEMTDKHRTLLERYMQEYFSQQLNKQG